MAAGNSAGPEPGA